MPIDGREWARVKRFVRRRYREIRDRLTPGDRNAVERALGMDDPRAIDLLVRTETELKKLEDGRVIRPGNYLLSGSRWTGVLDLNNRAQVAVFAETVRKALYLYP